ncbi:MAG: hypothetical protein AB8G05_01775 [Oligoflexales bacterium]
MNSSIITPKASTVAVATESNGEKDESTQEILNGAYLQRECIDNGLVGENALILCRVIDDQTSRKVNAKIDWIVTDANNIAIPVTDLDLRYLDESSEWHIEIKTKSEIKITAKLNPEDLPTEVEIIVDIKGGEDEILGSSIKDPVNEETVEEEMPKEETPKEEVPVGPTVEAFVEKTVLPSISEEFAGDSYDSAIWNQLGGDLNLADQSLECLGNAAFSYSGISTKKTYDFTGGSMTINVLSLVTNGQNTSQPLIWGFGIDAGNRAQFVVQGSKLIARHIENTVFVDVATKDYDLNTDKFFRISHSPANDTITYEISADGENWTQFVNTPAKWSTMSVNFEYHCGAYDNYTGAFSSKVDNYDLYLPNDPAYRPSIAAKFNGNSYDAVRWDQLGFDVILSDDKMQCLGNVAFSYSGIFTKDSYDFTDGNISIDILNVVTNGQDTSQPLIWGVKVNADNRAQFLIQGDKLIARHIDQTVFVDVAVKNYDPAQDNFLRISHSSTDDIIKFEISADGVNWTVFARTDSKWATNNLVFEYNCGAWNNYTGNFSSTIDNFLLFLPNDAEFKIEEVPEVQAAITEDFSANSYDTVIWGQFNGDLSLSNDSMQCSGTDGGASSYSGMFTKSAYDFTGGTMTIDAVEINTNGENTSQPFIWGIKINPENRAQLVVQGNKLIVRHTEQSNMIDIAEMSYDANAHKFFRLSHNSGDDTLTFEVSADGENWAEFASTPSKWSTTSIIFEYSCGAYETYMGAFSSKVDNYLIYLPNDPSFQ